MGRFGAENGIDFVALSFVKDAYSVRELKRVLARRGYDVDVIAKIEAADAINNLDSILEAADGRVNLLTQRQRRKKEGRSRLKFILTVVHRSHGCER